MEANRKEVDPSGQELIEGSNIAGEISPVNHRAPWPLAPPIGGVKLSNDQKRERKKAADMRHNMKRKRNEAELMEELEKLEEYFDELEVDNDNLKRLRVKTKALVDEENDKILSQLVDNYAGQNTEVQKARINKIEVNQAPIMSSKSLDADTISGENASMNLQTLPRPAQPAGSSGLPDDKQARKRIADKKYREKRKCTLDVAAERTTKLKEQNANLAIDNAVLKAEANQLQNQLDQLRDIREKMNSKFFQLEKCFVDLTGNWLVDTCMAPSNAMNQR